MRTDELEPSLSWKPTFVAITDKDFLLYDAAPTCKDEWALPVHSHSILATRYAWVRAMRYCLYSNLSVTDVVQETDDQLTAGYNKSITSF